MLGTVLQNRITRRFRRVAGMAAGTVILREIRKDGYLGGGALFLPYFLVRILYKSRIDLVAPFQGQLRERRDEEWAD